MKPFHLQVSTLRKRSPSYRGTKNSSYFPGFLHSYRHALLERQSFRHIFVTSLALLILMFLGFNPTGTAYAEDGSDQSDAEVLCLPGVYLAGQTDCTPAGPSAYLTGLAQTGIYLPLQPLPANPLDPSMPYMPYSYARLKEQVDVPMFGSLDDAKSGSSPTQYIEAGGLRYVSYIDAVDTDNSSKPDYFQLRSGAWISAQYVSQRESGLIRFQGLTFNSTPENDFGWIIPLQSQVNTKRTPGYGLQDYTEHQLSEYAVVQVYATQEVDGNAWVLVGPDEWLEQRQIGQVMPNTTPPEGVNSDRWIEVNLYEQTVAVYENRQLVYATLIASGVEPFFTRPGLFPIYKKLETGPMRGSFEADRSDFYYLEDVPWTMYFDEARAFHAAYWRTRFGFSQSHGCVNLSPGDAHWLFDWAQEGDWVYVWDPSGNTPTDPAFFTAGGA